MKNGRQMTAFMMATVKVLAMIGGLAFLAVICIMALGALVLWLIPENPNL